jgi:uncharacterized membrane protein YeaQ/YmgE (transglycosylase-associated protein family)
MIHMIVSALIHGLIYSGIRETMHGLGFRGIFAYVITGLIAAFVLHLVFRPRWRYCRRRWW